jgi:hypothetical protein
MGEKHLWSLILSGLYFRILILIIFATIINSFYLARYLKYAGFGPANAYDIQAYDPDNKFNDPMFIVEVKK